MDAAAAPPVHRNVSLVYRGVYEYTPDGVERVIANYKTSRYGRKVECHFDPRTQSFFLEGSSEHIDYAFMDFREVVDKFVTRKRAVGWAHRDRLSYHEHGSIRWTLPNKYSSRYTSRTQIHQDAHEDGTYFYIENWDPKLNKKDFSEMLELHERSNIPQRLQAAHEGCVLEANWLSCSVKVSSDDKRLLDTVMDKLRRVHEVFQTRFVAPVIHLVEVNGKRRFQLRLVALAKQKERLRTTVFEREHAYYSLSTDRFHSVRLMEYNPQTQKYVNGRVEIQPVSGAGLMNESRDWYGYRYRGFYPSKNLTFREDDDELETRILEPDDCVSNIIPETQDTFFQPLGPLNAESGFPEVRQTVRRPRQRSGMPGEEGMIGSLVNDLDNFPEPNVSTSLDVFSTPNVGDPDVGFSLGARPPAEAEDEPTNPSLRRPRERGAGGSGVPQNGPDDFSPQESTVSFLQLGARPGHITDENATPSAATTTRTVRAQRQKKSNGETKEEQSEAASRRIINTMSQKKPNSAARIDQSEKMHALNVRRMNEVFQKSFQHARNYRGHVKMEVQIGRLLYADLPGQVTRTPIEWNDWSPNISTDFPPFKTFFTNFVTSDYWDIEHIKDLQLPGGLPFFEATASSRSVTYEFQCREIKKGRRTFLQVDAEDFNPRVFGEPKDFGVVHLAVPTHSWDASFSLSGRNEFNVGQNPPIHLLVESLHAKNNLALADVRFHCAGVDFVVDRVLVKKETRNAVESLSPGVPIDLVVTEVQDLVLFKKAEGTGSETMNHYKAKAFEREKMHAANRLYYTVSLVPQQVNEELYKRNKDLDIGDVAQWTPKTIMDAKLGYEEGLIECLLGTTMALVKRIDDVGYANKV